MKLLFYTRLNRLWLEKIEQLRNEFSEVEFVTDAHLRATGVIATLLRMCV